VRTLRVEASNGSYDVHVGRGLLERARELVPVPESAENVALFADENLDTALVGGVLASLRDTGLRVEFMQTTGESAKSVRCAEEMWEWLADKGFHRGDLAVALGGGVVGDLGGFVAATFNRGMPWVVLPTTVLAMVDSSIGGKTGINLPQGKNLVGAFHQPRAVVADIDVLETLPEPAFRTGLAETLKHALISSADFLRRLLDERADIGAREPDTLEAMVADSAAVKVGLVNRDPFERGERAFLNYGHTLAHALESTGGYGVLSHGEAVAIGMMFAAYLAVELGYADRTKEHREALEAFGLPVTGARHDFETVALAMRTDKKYDKGMRFVVLEDIGRPAVVRDVPDDAVERAYEAVR
jgi:3-dehydroquinate synthase